MEESRTASERLADHAYDLAFDDLPGPVVQKAKELLVHHLGLALRAGGDTLGRQAADITTFLSGTGGIGGDCAVIGEQTRASLLDAVFANSLLMGYQGMDDFQMPAGIHQGVLTFPVALAFGERMHATGREVITAVVAGYDAVAKLAGSTLTYQLTLPRQAYTVFGAFGSATVAARLLKLSRADAAHALAHAAHVGVGLVEAGDCMEPLEPLVARNGAMAAVLARAGMPMARTSIDGKHGLYASYAGQVPDTLDASLSTLGRSFEILNVSSKRYGGSGLNIVPQELTAELIRAHDLTADDISSVLVTLPEERQKRETLMRRRLETGSDSPIWSAHFLIASVVATGGEIDPFRYATSRDAMFDRVLDTVELRYEAGRPMRYSRIEITTTGKARYVAEGDDYVMPPVDWFSWLAEGGRRIMSEDQLRHLVKLVESLEDVDDLTEVTDCLVPSPGTP